MDLNSDIYGIKKKKLLSGAVLFLFIFLLWDLTTGSIIFNNNHFFSSNDLSSVSIYHYGKKRDLPDFKYNTLTQIINEATPINPAALTNQPAHANFDRIVFHKTSGPDQTLLPLGYSDNNLIFQIVQWKPSDYYIENSNGELRDLLKSDS